MVAKRTGETSGLITCADAASWNLASDFNGVAEVGDVHACGSALSGQGGPACLFRDKDILY